MKVEQLFERGLEYERKETAEAIKLLNAKCKDALWMLYKNQPIWRGSQDGSLKTATSNRAFAIVDPTQTERHSRNTTNYYTLIIDNSPLFHDWPKRSHSMIAAAGKGDSEDHAEDYGDLYAAIPFDNVKIGCVNKGDIWETEVKIFNNRETFDDMNNDFDFAGISDRSWDHFVRSVEEIEFDDFVERFLLKAPRAMSNKERTQAEKLRDNFLPEIIEAYDPAKLGFSLKTTATLRNTQGEVWIGGPCVLIRQKTWREMLNAVGVKWQKKWYEN